MTALQKTANAATTDITQMSDIDILARTIYGEARGEKIGGMEAVASVVINRVKRAEKKNGRYWWGNSVRDVCLKKWQFSCWNVNDPNRKKIRITSSKNRTFQSCHRIAR
jgi:N-acetylmuramoyl-L-alanine amidase